MTSSILEEVVTTLAGEETKICVACKEPLPLEAFYASRASLDGRQSRCKSCDGLRDKNKLARASLESSGPPKPYVYKGVTGGPLLWGYVRE